MSFHSACPAVLLAATFLLSNLISIKNGSTYYGEQKCYRQKVKRTKQGASPAAQKPPVKLQSYRGSDWPSPENHTVGS